MIFLCIFTLICILATWSVAFSSAASLAMCTIDTSSNGKHMANGLAPLWPATLPRNPKSKKVLTVVTPVLPPHRTFLSPCTPVSANGYNYKMFYSGSGYTYSSDAGLFNVVDTNVIAGYGFIQYF
ncbi:hypothetical protein GYMLUDRAFT_40085 [Collybiopsis luxurians FD-317 M1]|nr:hypothetical protein GYMLUDRAFT_40085 [Collybiopsis luxurians FD-317 M1]